jgi:hypothetical protein
VQYNFIIYLENQWVSKKEKFVDCYIQKHRTLSMTATTRIEGNRSLLKRYLEVRTGTLLDVWQKIHTNMFTRQINKYKRL